MDTALALNILQIVLLLLITAGVAYLVSQSLHSARGTRKSLHARRQEICADLVRILKGLEKTGEIRKEELTEFRSRTLDAALVFDAEVAAYIDEFYARAVKLVSTNELLRGTALAVGEERDRITVEHTKQTIWLADQLGTLGKKFGGYIDVSKECAGRDGR